MCEIEGQQRKKEKKVTARSKDTSDMKGYHVRVSSLYYTNIVLDDSKNISLE